MTERREKRVILIDTPTYDIEGLPSSLAEFITWAQKHLASVPEEFRDSASIDFESHSSYGDPYTDLVIEYKRPETDDEVDERENAAANRIKRNRQHDLDELARLTAKYKEK